MRTRALIFLHGLHTAGCAATVDKHFVDYFTLQYMEDGGVELFYDDTRWLLEGAWVWPAYPGPRVRFHAAPGYGTWDHRYVAFAGPLASQWRTDGLYPTRPQSVTDGDLYASRFDLLLREFKRPGRWHYLKAVNTLEGILIDLAQARHQPSSREPWLDKVLSALEASDSFSPDYHALARRAGMSLSTLRRRFRAATGIPLHRHVLQGRIAGARRLLGETDLPMKVVAEKLGYTDVYFFARQFRKETGTTPGAFRRSRQT